MEIKLDWKEIKEKYPKSFWKFHKRSGRHPYINDLNILGYGFFGKHIEINDRDLFDFFDEQEIYVNIRNTMLKYVWCWSINYSVEEITAKSRQEAETVGFTKAFEILEEKLKNADESR